jgi:UPF0755 protein
MKLIGLDIGAKRIGVATADTTVKIAVPHSTILVDGTELHQIQTIMSKESTNFLVIGLPRNSKGLETPQSATTRQFAAKLHKIGAKVKFQDESLTSVLAETRLKKRKKSYKKSDIDSEAASIILQDFIEQFPHSTPPHPIKSKKKSSDPMRKSRKPKFFLALLIFLLILVTISAAATYFYHQLIAPPCQVNCPEKSFAIHTDESTQSISDRLEQENLIKNALAFQIYLKLTDQSSHIQAGNYILSSAQSVPEIVNILVSGKIAENTFRITFLPGDTLIQTKKHLQNAGYPEKDIDIALSKSYDHPVLADKPADSSLEGYIYGDTYEFYSGTTVEDIITRTLDQLYSVVETNDLIANYQSHGLTFYQGLTLASIIQREANPADMPQVAQIFLLRLKNGIILGSDATVAYAADQIDPNRDKTNMSYLDLDSPYNTRKYAGLPPGPISSPGLSALESVAHPAAGEYIYFLTGDDGMMYYAYTESEHELNKSLYCKELCLLL